MVMLGVRLVIFRRLVLVVVMRMICLGFAGGKRRACKQREEQSRRKQSLHARNPIMPSIAPSSKMPLPVPEEPPGSAGLALPVNSGSGLEMRVVMMVVVMCDLRSEQRTCNHHQEQTCCKQSLHATNPNTARIAACGA